MKNRAGILLVVVAVLAGAGCEDDGGVARDAGLPDGAGDAGGGVDVDVGSTDTGQSELGSDGAPLDGGPADASGDGSQSSGEAGTLISSPQAREVIAALPAETQPLTLHNRTFGLRLFQAVRSAPGGATANLFQSPHSISVALAMTYAGARGTTATQMATTLDFMLPAATLHRAFNGLDQELSRRSQQPSMDGEAPRLSIVNAIWGRVGTTFVPEYLDLLALNYGSGLRVLDFAGDANGSRLTINAWVEGQTAGRIKDLLSAMDVTPATVLVLTNAIYFKASWAQPFLTAATAMRPFHVAPATTVQVPTMQQMGSLAYAESAEVQVVELPYVGGQLAMTILAPRAGREAAFESGFTAAVLDTLVAGLAQRQVQLRMPKFTFSAKLKLKDTLVALGMPVAFGPQADFTGMIAAGGVAISDVIHQAFIAVDEKGTEAAAATAVVVGPPSGPPPVEVELNLDRPFLFVIRDRPTGAVLFVGRLADPRP